MLPLTHPEDRFLFTPNEPAAAVETPAAVSTETVVPSATTSEPSATTTPTATPSPGSTTPAAASAPASPASWLDSFRKEGFQAADEDTARTQLLQSHRDSERLRPLAPYAEAYRQNQAEFNQWLAQRQQAAQPVAQDWTKKLGWNPPEYNPAWKHQVHLDDKGNVVANDGTPADVALKYQQATAFRQDFIEKFLTNPGEALKPYIQHIAQEQAQQYAQQNVGQYREQQEATGFIEKHKDWLFDQHEGAVKTAQVLNTQTGRYESQKVLSKYGQAFVQHLQEGAQAGMSPEMQQTYAMKAVQNAYMSSPEYIDYLVSQRQAATPAAAPVDPRTAANDAFTRRANPAAAPTAPSGGNSRTAPQKVTRENLESTMLARFREAGIKDF